MLKRSGIVTLVVSFVVVLLLMAPGRLASADEDGSPDFGSIVIARDATDFAGYPIDVLDTYPSGIQRLVAIFEVKNVPPGSQIESQWYRNGQAASNVSQHVIPREDSSIQVIIRTDAGLAAGNWEVRVRYQGKVVDVGKFKIANKMVIFPLKFGEDYTMVNHELLNPQTDFPAGARSIATVFYYGNLPVGAKVDAEWIINGKSALVQHLDLESGNGTGATGIYDDKGVVSGTYELRILVNGKVEQFAQVTVKAAG